MRKGIKRFLLCTSSVILTASGIICAAVRLASAGFPASLEIAAAEMAMPIGNAEYQGNETSDFNSDIGTSGTNTNSYTSADTSHENSKSSNKIPQKSSGGFEASEPDEKELEEYRSSHKGEEQYPVNEFNATKGNISYKNVQVKNTASTNIDIKSELQAELGFKITKTDQPQVLIYHTHTTESYLPYDTGYFYESFFPRTTDEHQNVCAVGEEIAKELNRRGIVTIHDTTLHDYPSYNGAYDRSLETINKYLEKYPSIKVVLDIHRDGIGTDTEKSKPVFTAEGRKAAQIMILSGYNYDGCEEFRDWEYNLRFALRLQDAASKKYPEMVRALNFSDFMYNMNVNTGSLLIEVGAESNTVEEARYSGYLLGEILSDVLNNNKN